MALCHILLIDDVRRKWLIDLDGGGGLLNKQQLDPTVMIMTSPDLMGSVVLIKHGEIQSFSFSQT